MYKLRRITDPKIAMAVRGLCENSHAYYRVLEEAQQCQTSVGPCLNIWIRPSESVTGVACEVMVQMKDIEVVDKNKTTT